jgi:hypothetical protein
MPIRTEYDESVGSVSNGSRIHACGVVLDPDNVSVRFETYPKTQPAESWRAKPGPVPINPLGLPPWAKPNGSNLRCHSSGFTFIVAFRYASDNRILLILIHQSVFLLYWQHQRSKWVDTRTMPHSENEHQQSVNYCWSHILGNLVGDRFNTVINNVLAALIAKRKSQTLSIPSWK